MMGKNLVEQAHVAELGEYVSDALADLVVNREPAVLYDPVRYVLAGDGKRLRPVLLLLTAEMFAVARERALPVAMAVEVSHNFALVHDDIMDNAESRRGRPTVHVVWDTDTALLCGDMLMCISYDLIGQASPARGPCLMQTFSAMVAKLCEGQAMDKDFEQRPDVTTRKYLDMIDRKTGALLAASLEMGGILGEATSDQLSVLRDVGIETGRAFQIRDDYLDLVADDARWGKAIGGDLMEGKKTFLLLEALDRATGADRAFFARIHHGAGLAAGDIDEARQRMDALGVLAAARERVACHSEAAVRSLGALPKGAASQSLHWVIQEMAARAH